MPLNSIPATTTLEALKLKRNAAEGRCLVDYAFWGGVVPGNFREIKPLAESGVRGFKCFFSDSGVPEFVRVSEADLHLAMPIIAETGLPLLVHAESPIVLDAAGSGLEEADWSAYATYLASRPAQAEVDAIETMISLCRKYKCQTHIVHVSAAEALPLIKQAKLDGLPITAETCPHYLYFAAEDIQPGATHFKCAPPIRDKRNREQLWEALADGTLDLIATDHSPCPPQLKSGDFGAAWGGISSLSLALPIVHTAARQRGFGLEDVCRWMSSHPAKLAGFDRKKGAIAAGNDADLVVFDPDTSFEVTADRLHFRHACSPYIGEMLVGEVKQVFVRGNRVFDNGEFATHRLGREVCLRLASR
jgi:allantoinase